MTAAAPTRPQTALITLALPGPDRKRTVRPYHYRVTYRNPDPVEPGCVMTWDVYGGREPYQMALEYTADDDYAWHCSCADATYRGELDRRHKCKHVRGLIECIPAQRSVSG